MDVLFGKSHRYSMVVDSCPRSKVPAPYCGKPTSNLFLILLVLAAHEPPSPIEKPGWVSWSEILDSWRARVPSKASPRFLRCRQKENCSSGSFSERAAHICIAGRAKAGFRRDLPGTDRTTLLNTSPLPSNLRSRRDPVAFPTLWPQVDQR